MTVDVSVQATIDRPPDEVAGFAGDPGNAPQWYANIRSVDWRPGPPVRVGSRIDFVASFLGRRLAYTYEVVELTERRLVMRTEQGPFPMETTYSWEPVDRPSPQAAPATLMTLRNRGEPRGFAAITRPVMERAMRRAMTKDLQRLKELLESR